MGDVSRTPTPVVTGPAASAQATTTGPTTGTSTTASGTANSTGQEKLAGTPGSTPDSPELSDLFDAISAKYSQIILEQARGVEELRQDASVQDPPPAWVNIAIAVGTVALGAATAGIGAAVSGAVVSAAANSEAAIVIGDALKEVIKVGVEQGLASTIQGSLTELSSNPATNVTDAFFRGQSDTLHTLSAKTQDAFNLNGRKKLRTESDPLAAARAAFTALDAGFKVAKATQRRETLASWCSFQARGALGTHNEGKENAGTNLSEQLGDTSGKGVLGLIVTAGSGTGPVKIIDAEIEGLNETLRGELAVAKIGEMRLPITVKGEVNPPAWYEKRTADGMLRFGENESGTRWNESSPGAEEWLRWRGIGGPVLAGPEGYRPSREEQVADIWKGIDRILDQDIKPKSLKQVGVALSDPAYYD